MKFRGPSLQALLLLLPLGAIAGTEPPPPVVLEPYAVTGSRLPALTGGGARVLDRAFLERSGALRLQDVIAALPWSYAGAGSGAATVPDGSPGYGNALALFNFSGASASLRQTGVAAAGLRGLGAGGTLVLIDGRRAPLSPQGDTASDTGAGFQDLASIPLGLVDRVEILPDSASPIYGADAVGGVINVVLKRDYTGGELAVQVRGTTRGGGLERGVTLSSGWVRGPFSLMVGVSAYERQSLKASQRSFSAAQDHTARGGFNYELGVGSPAVIGAASGLLNGLTLPDGNRVRFARVKTGQDGSAPALDDFEPVASNSAGNLRRYNTAANKDLIGALTLRNLQLSAGYDWTPRLQAFFSASWSERTAETANEPPATLGGGFGGANSRVLAANPLNPFGQDLLVSLVHVEAPLRPQTVDVTNSRFTAGLRGPLAGEWTWEAAAAASREHLASRTLELSTANFADALRTGRFNPFGDPATRPINAALYSELMAPAIVTGTSRLVAADFQANGPLLTLPGGVVTLATGAEVSRATRHRESSQPSANQTSSNATARTTNAVYLESVTPLFGEGNDRPGLRRLTLRLAARHEQTSAFRETTPHYAIHWSPWSALTIHGGYAAGFRAPSLSENETVRRTDTINVNDPVLGQRYPVTTLRGSNPAVDAERSASWQAGLTVDAHFLRGLSFHLLGRETYYQNKLTTLSEQTIVSSAALFPDRVTRDSAGRITEVDATTVNFGKIYTRSLDLGLVFERDTTTFGRWTFRADAVHQFEYRTELTPGRPAVVVADGADTLSPPRWSLAASLWWSRGGWEAGVNTRFLDGFSSNSTGPFLDQAIPIGSWTTVDLRIGYRFGRDLWRGFGKDLRILVGVGNVADRDPPYANTVYGYHPGLHNPLGRTYDISLRLPF